MSQPSTGRSLSSGGMSVSIALLMWSSLKNVLSASPGNSPSTFALKRPLGVPPMRRLYCGSFGNFSSGTISPPVIHTRSLWAIHRRDWSPSSIFPSVLSSS